MKHRLLAALLLITSPWASHLPAQQKPDTNFDVSVASPAYVKTHPRVVIDEAHNNFHTADGRYKPFATLLRNDGYNIQAGTSAFTPKSLAGIGVLVISNALGEGATASTDTSPPAFTPAETAAVADWVRAGGALLLISDHTPMGEAAALFAERFGVTMGKGFVATTYAEHRSGSPTQLMFSRANGLLRDHPITRGRNASERVDVVKSFTGQSLSVPAGGESVLALGEGAWELPTRTDLQKASEVGSFPASGDVFKANRGQPVHGRSQGVAFVFGKGRVVILGEAAMMSAQVTGATGEGRMGMNVAGSQNKQFVLNVLHWLTRLI